VVISIIAVLISVLLPALSKAREEGKKVVCMSNMKEIGGALSSYLVENDNLPWTYIHSADGSMFPGISYFSSYTWSGMMAARPWPGDEQGDWALVPPELRPLNKLLAPEARNKDQIKVLQCPGDRSAVSPTEGEGPDELQTENTRSSWQAYGNSYSINWNFLDDPAVEAASTGDSVSDLMGFGKLAVQQCVGGSAAEFAVIWENQVDQLLVGSTLTGGGRLAPGWHKKFSFHTFLFMDGHSEHRNFDTRYPRGPGWRTWIR
jgi:hypothetical protein